MKQPPTFCFPISGPARLVGIHTDFTRSQPGKARTPPSTSPVARSAALRVTLNKKGEWIPVDPLFLLCHLDIGDGGEVRQLSRSLAGFIAACCVDRPPKRLKVAGPPAPATRVLQRGSELALEPRTYFTAPRCVVRCCSEPVISGNFCATHLDAGFQNGVPAREASKPPPGSVASTSRLAAEVRHITGAGFEGWWAAIGQWLSNGAVVSTTAVRRFVINFGIEMVPVLSTKKISGDRLPLLAFVGPVSTQKAQTFLNIALTTKMFRTLADRVSGIAAESAAALSRVGVWEIDVYHKHAAFFRDRGTVPVLRMPVLPTLLDRGHAAVAGLVFATLMPSMTVDGSPRVAICSATAVLVMAHILGATGDFSFSVVHGTAAETDIIFDAAAPLTLKPHLLISGSTRQQKTVSVINPAALSFAVMHQLILLGYQHVRFHGPRLGARGLLLPTFTAGDLDPEPGFLWGVLQTEAASRGTVVDVPGVPDSVPFGTEPGSTLDVFVTDTTAVRCADGCSWCTAESGWHRDCLLAEFAFGKAAAAAAPRCARLGIDRIADSDFAAAVSTFWNLVDATVAGPEPYLETNN